jgi:hypothetical protein
MSDYNSQLPIRTENNGDAKIIIVDGTVTSQLLKVNADGSLNITDNGGSLTVDGTVTVTATDLDIRDLSHTQDSVKIGDGTDFLAIDASGNIGVTDAGGSLTVDGTVTVTATDLDIRDIDAAQDNIAISDGTDTMAVNTDGSINVVFPATAKIKVWDGTDELAVNADGSINSVVTATNLDIRDLSHTQDSVKVGDGTDFLAIAADGSIAVTDNGGSLTVDGTVTVTATDLDIRDLSHTQDSVKIGDGTDFLAVNTDGSINVKITDGSPGTEVNDYDTDAAVAGGATGTHTYTSGGNFYLQQIEATASGKLKIVVKVNGVTKFVGFNSTANPNISFHLEQPILATSGQTVTVERTNKDNQAQDVYSTISGYLA